MSDTPETPVAEASGAHPAENELRAARTRRRKIDKPNPLEPPVLRAKPDSSPSASKRHVPHGVRHRFVQVGHVYYFQDGAKAFEDHGRRLTTPSENSEVVASLIAIAQVRGWKRVIATGSERFRQEAWRQATTLGIAVRGYKPNEVEQAKLAQELARTREADPAPAPAKRTALPTKDQAPEVPLESRANVAPSPPLDVEDRGAISGALLESGRARYRQDPDGALSYYVRLSTWAGERTVWGTDLERALQEAHSKPQVGDDVVLRREGREPVSIRYADKRPDGTTVTREEVKFRNRWSIETETWLTERAALVAALRNPGKSTERAPPELANARLALRQAELMAEKQIPEERQRTGFVAAVREQLAQRLARGDAVPAPTLRSRSPDLAPRERGALMP